jgi:hypothetical protein
MHQQPIYKSREPFPVAEDLSRRGLYLPSSSHLKQGELETVVRFVRAYLELPRRRRSQVGENPFSTPAMSKGASRKP